MVRPGLFCVALDDLLSLQMRAGVFVPKYSGDFRNADERNIRLNDKALSLANESHCRAAALPNGFS
jgi:hypothetical protein